MTAHARRSSYWLFLILVLAAAVRFWGIAHDLPDVYYPDERHFINRSLAFGSGDFNPHWFHKPAFYMYILFFEFGLYYLAGHLLGLFENVDAFARHYFTDPTVLFLLGRSTTALFGVATVYLLYVIGRHYGERVALLGSFFLALAFGHVWYSHYALTDIPTTFFSTVTFLFVVKIAETGHVKHYMLAGLFAGLGTATKYYSITMLPCIYLAHLLWAWERKNLTVKLLFDGKVFAAFGAWLLAFFMASPFNFLDPYWLETNVLPLLLPGYEGTTTSTSVFESSRWMGAMLGIKQFWTVIMSSQALGPVLGGLSLLGMLFLIARPNTNNILLLSVPLVFLLIAALYKGPNAQPRHLSPTYPFLCLAAAIALVRVTNLRWIQERSWMVGVLGVLCVIPSAYAVVQFDYRISQKETRTLAKEWIMAHIPPGTKILLDSHGPTLNTSRERLLHLYEKAKALNGEGPFTANLERYYRYQLETASGAAYDLTRIHHFWWRKREESPETKDAHQKLVDQDFGNPVVERGVKPLDHYIEMGIQYVITTSEDYEPYLNGSRGDAFPTTRQFYRALFERGTLIKKFHPDPWKHSGPVVKIFRLPSAS